ncbi:Cro/Cl family transcriptional regulator [Isoptericola sp. NEAU-Y5]|uniref:Cro/Cl family transcriptional regulator n=1 Tax=Isoptericola luteus TaxID=2879484 RepID=A0ABS7ZGS4_9MICO|nr:sugar-binding domain-containing protein [Isoptericola sp. NEAU-Y5]MCA5894218.1 Cro/Cl family transcriptional regulator [Isoptericola sp. NEAU-Y5]
MSDPEHARLLVDVSRDYYLDGSSKVDIAQRYGVSRFQVARLLAEARDSGIVRIEITPPAHLDGERSRRLADALGAEQVVVVPSGSDAEGTRTSVAHALARVLAERAPAGTTIGISWSRTVEAAVHHLGTLPPCDVVQLVGALPVSGAGDSLGLTQTFRSMSGVRTWPVWSPLLVGDPSTAAGMRRQTEIAAALDRADSLDLAVVAVGAWTDTGSTVYPQVTGDERRAAAAGGAIAECSGRLFDAAGRRVVTPLDARVVGVTLDQLVRTPEVVAVGYGAQAGAGLRAAVLGGVATVLVCDEAAALEMEHLLEAPSA